VVLVPGSMVLLEQIADNNLDALVNLGCFLYKVKNVTSPQCPIFCSIFPIFLLRIKCCYQK